MLLLLVMRIFGCQLWTAGISSISSIHVFRCDKATWLKLTSSFDEPNHGFVETKQKRKHTLDEGRRKVIDQDIAVCRNDWGGVGGRGAIVVRLTTLGHTQDSSYFIWDWGFVSG